jgi:hypothetical protein
MRKAMIFLLGRAMFLPRYIEAGGKDRQCGGAKGDNASRARPCERNKFRWKRASHSNFFLQHGLSGKSISQFSEHCYAAPAITR